MIYVQKYKLTICSGSISVTGICFLTCCSLNGARHDRCAQPGGVLLDMGVQPGLLIAARLGAGGDGY